MSALEHQARQKSIKDAVKWTAGCLLCMFVPFGAWSTLGPVQGVIAGLLYVGAVAHTISLWRVGFGYPPLGEQKLRTDGQEG